MISLGNKDTRISFIGGGVSVRGLLALGKEWGCKPVFYQRFFL